MSIELQHQGVHRGHQLVLGRADPTDIARSHNAASISAHTASSVTKRVRQVIAHTTRVLSRPSRYSSATAADDHATPPRYASAPRLSVADIHRRSHLGGRAIPEITRPQRPRIIGVITDAAAHQFSDGGQAPRPGCGLSPRTLLDRGHDCRVVGVGELAIEHTFEYIPTCRQVGSPIRTASGRVSTTRKRRSICCFATCAHKRATASADP